MLQYCQFRFVRPKCRTTGARLTMSFDFVKRRVGRRARLLGKGALRLLPNGSRLCVVADLDALHCQPTKMLIRCTKLQFCTEPAIPQNRCCAFVVLFCPLYSRSILLLLGSHTLCQVLVCVSARATWQCVWLVGWF